jgi:hypothetical protein
MGWFGIGKGDPVATKDVIVTDGHGNRIDPATLPAYLPGVQWSGSLFGGYRAEPADGAQKR